MKPAFLAQMRCPLCSGDLVRAFADDVVQSGVVGCDCREYPVVDGILLLDPSLPLRHILRRVRNRDIFGALAIALATWRGLPLKLAQGLWPGAPYALLDKLHGGNPIRLLRQLYMARQRPTFWELSPPYEAVQWEYMRQRFASDSFLAANALLPLAAPRSGPLLDLGCGSGHYSFMLRSQRRRAAHLCVDAELPALLIARHYFAPEADFVHVNGDLPLPFKDGSIDLVFGSDMLHYSRAKATTGAELGRVLAADGLAILPHVHNAAQANPCAGAPLTLDGYRRILNSLSLAFLPDDLLVRGVLAGESLDLASEVDDVTVERSHAFAILASHRSSASAQIVQEPADWPERMIVNPIFETKTRGDILEGCRCRLSTYYWDEYPASHAYFPQQLQLTRSEFENEERLRDLMRRFLLVGVPTGFMLKRPEETWLGSC
jgi:SAM-dependent methyltransferase